MTSENDDDLWRRARAGDKDARLELTQRLEQQARKQFGRSLQRPEELDDLIQEATEDLLRALRIVEAPSSSLEGFLFWRVRGAFKKLRRQRPQWRELNVGIDPICRHDGPSQTMIEDEKARFLIDCKEGLTPDERRFFEMRYDRENGLGPIGESFGHTESWACRQLKRILDALRNCLQGKGVFAP